MAFRWTNKKRAFIEFYLIYWNASKAAREAGYSKKTAYAIGHKLLKEAEIKAEIQRRLTELQASADEVIQRLSDQARSDIGDFMDIGSMGFSLDLNKAKELGLTHLIKKVKQRTTTTLHKDGTEEERHWIEVELYDAQAALVHLGRHHKLFTDRLELPYDWRSEMIELIKDGKITYDQLLPEFGDDLVRDLFKNAGKEIVLSDD